jgi:hypothetical protein
LALRERAITPLVARRSRYHDLGARAGGPRAAARLYLTAPAQAVARRRNQLPGPAQLFGICELRRRCWEDRTTRTKRLLQPTPAVGVSVLARPRQLFDLDLDRELVDRLDPLLLRVEPPRELELLRLTSPSSIVFRDPSFSSWSSSA